MGVHSEMSEPQTDQAKEGNRLQNRRLLRVLTSSSVLLATLYVLGFIYLKGYLAAFGFQVELASLSIPNLLLVHRFFVGHHFFVVAGAAHGFLFSKFGRRGVRENWIAAIFILLFPVLLLPFDHWISVWSEKGTPAGFNMSAPGLVRVFALGWGCGCISYYAVRAALTKLSSLRDALKYVAAVGSLAATVATYRYYSNVVAIDRIQRGDLQLVQQLELGGASIAGPCGVVYVDTESVFLRCSNLNVVLRKSALDRYTVVSPPSPSAARK